MVFMPRQMLKIIKLPKFKNFQKKEKKLDAIIWGG